MIILIREERSQAESDLIVSDLGHNREEFVSKDESNLDFASGGGKSVLLTTIMFWVFPPLGGGVFALTSIRTSSVPAPTSATC